ncbi:6868_t:CDS:1, partial [Dentiscutata heterogama]
MWSKLVKNWMLHRTLFVIINIVNGIVFINEIVLLAQVIVSYTCSDVNILNSDCADVLSLERCSDYLAVHLYYIFDTIRQFCYLIIKPGMLFLAYQRCYAVYKSFLGAGCQLANYLVIISRILLWLAWCSVAIYNYIKCQGSYCDPQCEFIPITFVINDAFATFYRAYYILLELLFYISLFRRNQPDSLGDEIIRDISRQKILFGIDIIQLLAMCAYRIVGL